MNQILDLGCADEKLGNKDKFPDYDFEGKVTGLDYIRSKATDVICDLNKGKLPFKNDTFDIVFAHHTLEHIERDAIIKLIPEVYRVLKEKGYFLIRVPYLTSISSFSELTHKTRFGWDTLDVFIFNKPKHYARYSYQIEKKDLFIQVKRKMIFRRLHRYLGIQFFANKFPNIYEGFFCWMFPASEIYWELEK